MNTKQSLFSITKPFKKWPQILWVLSMTAILLAACATPAEKFTPTPIPTLQPTATSGQEATTPAISAAKSALAINLHIDADTIQFVKIQPVQWPDSCLGVPSPGIMCAFHVVDGYRITLSANNQTYEVHTNLDGSQVVLVPDKTATSLNPDDASKVVEGFLSTLKADPSGKSSLDYLSQPLQADLQSGDTVPSLLGVQNMYSSFGLLSTKPIPGTDQVLVSAGLNFVSPAYRSFVLVNENNTWKINTFIVYAIHLIPPTDSIQFLPADETILEYVQALQNKDATAAWGFLSPKAQASISQADLEREVKGFQSVVAVNLILIENGKDHLTYNVTLWANPNQTSPVGWQAGKNTRSFEMTQTDQGWQIDQIAQTS